jgi:hypothetical protein
MNVNVLLFPEKVLKLLRKELLCCDNVVGLAIIFRKPFVDSTHARAKFFPEKVDLVEE